MLVANKTNIWPSYCSDAGIPARCWSLGHRCAAGSAGAVQGASVGGHQPGLLVGAVHVPQDAGVVHDHDEGPHALALHSQLLQAVSFQFQVVVGKFLNKKPGST